MAMSFFSMGVGAPRNQTLTFGFEGLKKADTAMPEVLRPAARPKSVWRRRCPVQQAKESSHERLLPRYRVVNGMPPYVPRALQILFLGAPQPQRTTNVVLHLPASRTNNCSRVQQD